MSGIVRVSWSPLRRDPTHASEMVSQVLLGEVLRILEFPAGTTPRPGWVAVRAPDGYEGFVTRGSLLECTESAAADWTSRADSTSLGTGLELVDAGGTGDEADVRHAPWGARLVSTETGTVELPGGGKMNPTDFARIVVDADRMARYPRDSAKLIGTAEDWMGTPYLWGGRTQQGVDCSGFVQSVFGLHGFALARDSRDQFEAGSRVSVDAESARVQGLPGDLWFFAFEGGPVSHVGICRGDARLIHASETRGCVATDALGEGDTGCRLAEGFVGAIRLAG